MPACCCQVDFRICDESASDFCVQKWIHCCFKSSCCLLGEPNGTSQCIWWENVKTLQLFNIKHVAFLLFTGSIEMLLSESSGISFSALNSSTSEKPN
jgi:hypothetical protein